MKLNSYDKVILNEIVDRLNIMLLLDQPCIADLFLHRSYCSCSALAEHPTVTVGGTIDGKKEFGFVRLIGLLNGLLTSPDSPYRLAMEFSDNEYTIIRFKVICLRDTIPPTNQASDH